jgi:hypothetical protein
MLREAMRVMVDEVAFLRSHVSQLTQQITLAPPSGQEELKANRWWQFWNIR